MAYEFVKVKGRVQFYKDGEFDHQQFRGHWGYRDPAAYIVHCEALDAEAIVNEAERQKARKAEVADYLARRAARACHAQMELFA